MRKRSILVVVVVLAALLATLRLSHAQQVQSFVSKPVDTSVNLGDTALLKCSVSARHGDVQWIHDGTALGYDRKVPGKPRYSVSWVDNEDTEYHLQISNVTLDDEGVFSCQVAPIGDWDTKLEAKAKLTVLVAPKTAPELMYNDVSKHSNELVHFKVGSTKLTKFTCIVRKSKPAASFRWYINDTLINKSVGKILDTKISVDGIREDMVSVLELNGTKSLFNNSVVRCQALHAAFSGEPRNLSSTLRMIAVTPPSDPIISGYDDTIGVLAGTELGLMCSSKYTFPSAMLSWYRDGKLISKNYDTIESSKTTESFYRIGKVAPSDNKAILKCSAINQALDDPLSVNVTLNVLYGPEKINMTGQFEAEEGKQISAFCFTEPSNPTPSLKFSINGLDFEPTTLTSGPIASLGAFAVNATFVYTVGKEHNNKEIKCIADNRAANIQQVITKQIKVLYPATSLVLRYAEENKTVIEGTKVRITCVSEGGNPLPEIEWKLNGQKLPVSSVKTFSSVIESTVEIITHRNHHTQVVECVSTNKVNTLKRQTILNVSYLPSSVHMKLIDPPDQPFAINSTVKAGTRVVFACVASGSYPQSHITWYKDGYAMGLQPDHQENITSTLLNNKDYETTSYISFIVTSADYMKELRCDVRIRDISRTMHGSVNLNVKFAPEIIKYPPSIIDVNENSTFSLNLMARANPNPTYLCTASNGVYYPSSNTSNLTFVATRKDNTDFSCKIANSENTTLITFRLNVKYASSAKMNSSLYTTVKGNSTQLYCLVDGNPLQSNHITWRLNNKPLSNTDAEQRYAIKFIPPSLSILTIKSARDTDDGQFSCHVANTIGLASSASTELRVKRAPTILVEQSNLKAGEEVDAGKTARFECKSVGYPDINYKWRNPANIDLTNNTKYSITNARLDAQLFTSVLIIQSVTSTDYGLYTCEARNENGTAIAKALLSGKHQPEQPTEFRYVNATKNSIILAWKKNFNGGDAQKFRIRYRKDTMDPTYSYIETEPEATSAVLRNLDMATRYIINIQSFNSFGTEGFLRDPLFVQTDFGFTEINQMPIYTGNDLPLTIILVVCGVGTILLLLNVALIAYLINKKKKKGEADSTTDTNETEANTVEMFSPPPPYPDELNYQFDLNMNGFEDENKPFMPHLRHQNRLSRSQLTSSKYLKDLTDQLDYPIEYATPIHQSWQHEQTTDAGCDDELYINSLRQLDKNITAALAGVSKQHLHHQQQQQQLQSPYMQFTNRYSSQYDASPSFSSLNHGSSPFDPNILIETRAYPSSCCVEPSTSGIYQPQQPQQPLKLNNQNQIVLPSNSLYSSTANNLHHFGKNLNASTCKIYQDLDEYKGHLV